MLTSNKGLPDAAGTSLLTLAMLLFGCSAAGQPEEADTRESYEVVFTIDLTTGDDTAIASIRTGRNSNLFRQLSMDVNPERYRDFRGDGELRAEDGEITWRPPREGGTLSYRVTLTNKRRNGAFDARVTDDWALFRADDLFPSAATRVEQGAVSESRLEFRLPEGWSVATRWERSEEGYEYPISNPTRRFDRPTGWLVAGNIGVRRARIGKTEVVIAGPVGENFRRMDMMAFLNWTLPGVVDVFPTMDPRLLIVGADDPMWRGGLSGPGSLYVHADRPLISENGTSTFVHELVHVAMGASGSEHDDWLLEGLAEYYSVRILDRSGTLPDERIAIAFENLSEWGADIDTLFTRRSTGPRTARAAILLADLDAEIRREKPDSNGLDDVIAGMLGLDAVYDYAALCQATREVLGKPAMTLTPANVPGAPDVDACKR